MSIEVVATNHKVLPIHAQPGDRIVVTHSLGDGRGTKVIDHHFDEPMVINRATILKIKDEFGFQTAIGAVIGTAAIVKGARVRAKQNAGFHKGAVGTVEFVEPAGGKVWVMRDGASSPVYYHEDELEIIQDA